MANTSPQAIAGPLATADPSSSGFIRAERWMRAFTAQATQATYRSAIRYARFRSRMVRMAGKKVDRLYVHDLVHDAFGDTWSGVTSWDPGHRSLLDHVRGVIRWRSQQDAEWIRRRPHISLDDGDEPVAVTQPEPIMLGRITAEVVALLRRMAEGDDSVRLILEAWEGGHLERADVIVATGLSPRTYKAARARITYLVRNLPQSVRDRAIDVLRSVQ